MTSEEPFAHVSLFTQNEKKGRGYGSQMFSPKGHLDRVTLLLAYFHFITSQTSFNLGRFSPSEVILLITGFLSEYFGALMGHWSTIF